MPDRDLVRYCHQLVKKEDWTKAWHLANNLMNESPEEPELLYLMGHILRAQGHIGLALPVLSKAISKEQKQPNLWMNFGATLHDLNRWDEAIQAFSVVSAMLPKDPMPPANIAASNLQKGKWRDAINWSDKALALDSENYIAHITRNFACLALGRWKDAWQHAHYIYGNHLVIRVYNLPENEEPLWDGSPGKNVVVQCDQGVGDIIMFAQFLPRLQKDCAEVIVECAERLVPLFRRNFPGVHVYGTLKHAGQGWSAEHRIDAHTHISFLGKYYISRDDDFDRKAYIQPDEALVATWREWLEKHPKPWKGIAWRGGIQNTQKHLRSIELADWKPVIELPGTTFDLSYHDSTAEVARWNKANPEHRVISPPIDASNYDDTMAFLWCLDEVCSVTTAVSHACGSMGRTARILVPEVPTWRYAYQFGDGKSLIWYPEDSVRLYRRKPGEPDWRHAVRRIVNDIGPVKLARAA